MIPGDLGDELSRAIGAAAAAGELPAGAEQVSPSGTWRPAPPPGGPASYATSMPFELAGLSGRAPANIARSLADAIGKDVSWITAAAPTGDGYLTITVSRDALAGLAVRIPRAGPGCARSAALRGVAKNRTPLPDLAAEPGWEQAWHDQEAAMAGRLAEAAGATMTERPGPGEADDPPPPGPGGGPVARAVACAGVDAVRYRLARTLPGHSPGEQAASVVNELSDPYYSVAFAHADASSTLRWAADLGLARTEPDRRLAELLSQPPELALLGQLSWLAERVAGAARRDRPAELPRYLEQVARAWLDCRERCPALPFGGRAAPREAAGISARLWLAAATATVLATGLDLVGVAARDRL